MNALLRRATAADAAAVRDLFCRSFTATFGHLYPPPELVQWLAQECPPEQFAHWCSAADHACMLGLDPGGRLLGYCLMGALDLPLATDRPWWVLRQLYLEEEAKGSGLADRLLGWAVDEARARGFADLCLTVWIGNHRARRFYARHGFAEVGRYPFRVGSTVDDDRILRRALA